MAAYRQDLWCSRGASCKEIKKFDHERHCQNKKGTRPGQESCWNQVFLSTSGDFDNWKKPAWRLTAWQGSSQCCQISEQDVWGNGSQWWQRACESWKKIDQPVYGFRRRGGGAWPWKFKGLEGKAKVPPLEPHPWPGGSWQPSQRHLELQGWNICSHHAEALLQKRWHCRAWEGFRKGFCSSGWVKQITSALVQPAVLLEQNKPGLPKAEVFIIHLAKKKPAMAQNLGMQTKIMLPVMAKLLGRQDPWEGPGMFQPVMACTCMLFTLQKMSIWKHNQPKGKARDGSKDSNTSNSLVKDLNKEKAKNKIKKQPVFSRGNG